MKPTTKNSRLLFVPIALAIVALCILTPLASAANLGPFGDVRGDNWTGPTLVVAVIGIALAVPLFWPIHAIKNGKTAAGGVIVGLALMGILLFNPSAPGTPPHSAASLLGGNTQAAAAAATSTGSLAWDPALYERTSSLTLSAVDANPTLHTAISPAYDLYCLPASSAAGRCPTGTSEEQAVIGSGSAVPGGSALTMTNGQSTAAVTWQAASYGCGLGVHFDLSGYYESLQSVPTADGTTACAPVRGTQNLAVSFPPFEMKKAGTFVVSQVGGGTTLTCSAGSDCVFGLQVATSVAGTYLEHVALKVGTLTNATINSIDATTVSTCHIETGVQGTDTIIVIDANGGEVDSSHTPLCNIHISRSSGSSGGSYSFTADDLYKQYQATEFVTNTNIRNAAAVTSSTFTFA